MPSLIVIAGPNGAGKTTFAREYLSADERRLEFVNADEIARGLRIPSDFSARCKIQEDGMNQKAEIERMQAAFKRAAEKAMRGTREERSGRFEVLDDSRFTRGDTQAARPTHESNSS